MVTNYYDTIIVRFRPGIVDTLIVEVSMKYYDGYYEFYSLKIYNPGGNIAIPFDSRSPHDFFLSK